MLLEFKKRKERKWYISKLTISLAKWLAALLCEWVCTLFPSVCPPWRKQDNGCHPLNNTLPHCSDNSAGRTQSWWKETWNYFKWMGSPYFHPRLLHAESSLHLSSSPRLPDSVSPQYNKGLENNSHCIARARRNRAQKKWRTSVHYQHIIRIIIINRSGRKPVNNQSSISVGFLMTTGDDPKSRSQDMFVHLSCF